MDRDPTSSIPHASYRQKGRKQSAPSRPAHVCGQASRLFFVAACLGLLLVLLNMLGSLMDSPLAFASGLPATLAARHHAQSNQPLQPTVSGTGLTPNLNPQPLSIGTWHAPQATSTTTQANPPFAVSINGRKPGEQPDLRTATSETFLNKDGTWTLKSYGAPIHYKDA